MDPVSMNQRPEREHFEGHEGSRFTIVGTGVPGAMDQPFGPIEIELTDVEDRSSGIIDAFSLLFRGPREQEFRQANYRLAHPDAGEVDLFLVPIMDPMPRDDRICYQAIISRFVEEKPAG